jgi:hypothetical protein
VETTLLVKEEERFLTQGHQLAQGALHLLHVARKFFDDKPHQGLVGLEL